MKIRETIDAAKNISTNTADKIAKTANIIAHKTQDAIDSTTTKIRDKIDEKKEAVEQARQNELNAAKEALHGTKAEEFIQTLGESPIELSKNKIAHIKKVFPIPKEQIVLWADAEFDLRPSGIVCTEKGVFIKSNTSVWSKKQERNNEEAESDNKSVLFYYHWEDFEPEWFADDSETDNKVLLVEPQCRDRFIDVCRSFTLSEKAQEQHRFSQIFVEDENYGELIDKITPIAGAAVESSEAAIFAEQKAHINTPAGHGEMAEEAITKLDKLLGLDAKVVGRDNAKDGADRLVEGVYIQTKYYNSARGSLEACFNPQTGDYRYINSDGTPMQLEVPKDQYQRVLEGFKQKIADGKVPGVTDPNEASNIVREGRLTYKQAVNLTKAGTIESLSYDALTGAVICSCAFGLTFVVTVFLTWRKTGNLRESIQAGASTGIQVFGISFLQHMVVSQIARTSLANSLIAPSQYIVGKLGHHTSATIINGIRALSGKSAIYGAAASKQLAKVLRTNVLTSLVTFAVFSVPETYNLASRKISAAQYTKNMSVLAGSIAGGAGGAVVAGIAAAKIAGVAGTAISPGVGTAIGIAGGFVGGAVGAKVVDVVGDILHEDDIETIGRLFNAMVSCSINEYMLDGSEMDKLIEQLNRIPQKEFKKLFQAIQKTDKQEETILAFLEPYFDGIVKEREPFLLPSEEEMIISVTDLFVENSIR